MAMVALAAVMAATFGAAAGYVLSKRAVRWCPTCGRDLVGHCPDVSFRSVSTTGRPQK